MSTAPARLAAIGHIMQPSQVEPAASNYNHNLGIRLFTNGAHCRDQSGWYGDRRSGAGPRSHTDRGALAARCERSGLG